MTGDGQVVVTGGTRGIGLAISRHFIQSGDSVTAFYGHDHAAAREAVQQLGSDGRYRAVACDVSDPAALVRAIEEAWQIEPIRALVNNAAKIIRAPFLEIALSDWEAVIDTTLRGYFLRLADFCAARRCRRTKRQDREHIVDRAANSVPKSASIPSCKGRHRHVDQSDGGRYA